MAGKLLPDDLWAVIEPLLPPVPPPGPNGGRPRVGDRPARAGILFVLRTGLPWEDRPAEMGCGCGMSCGRRLAAWQADRTWDRIHAARLERLHAAGKLDWSKCAIDSSSVRAAFGGSVPARTRPTGGRPAPSTT